VRVKKRGSLGGDGVDQAEMACQPCGGFLMYGRSPGHRPPAAHNIRGRTGCRMSACRCLTEKNSQGQEGGARAGVPGGGRDRPRLFFRQSTKGGTGFQDPARPA